MAELQENGRTELAPASETPPAKPAAESKPISRRSLLKAAVKGLAITGVGITTGMLAEKETGAISKFFQEDPENIERRIPPQLEHLEIPFHNEHYKSPYDVVQTALDAYTHMGGHPYYETPESYLNSGEAIIRYLSESKNDIGNEKEPVGKMLAFSQHNNKSLKSYYERDPGTSVGKIIGEKLEEESDTDEDDDEDEEKAITNAYKDFFARSVTAIDQRRDGKRISTADLLEYYLEQNDGNIVESLWDTTVFFKLAARADIDELMRADEDDDPYETIQFESRSGAEFLAERFYDEFSKEIPLEWLVENVDPNAKTLNTAVEKRRSGWKDFMPVNRSGTFYHVYNLIALSANMDPSLVEQITTIYYNKNLYPSENITKAHGRIKQEADMTAAHQARDIRKLIEKYKVD